ncbi:MAG: sugar transferase [Richelia sp. RM2_1_2]|nr:sugar transferase [Richelia sp. SM2_1_7]NJM19365.1 sugar transferase [Richelia sp. SM1_7_0]NJN10167.1 sugar transferase [Richelia sp. RM1_1_1]NJO30984.1 sugar transferase [Richelia sp. SL_2_1]NJO57974.1 sugar transferase [Richelia sp. RM2_1_2]
MQEALFRKESVTLESQKVIRSIPKLLLLSDIFGLVSSLGFIFWLRFNQSVDWFNPISYGFIFLVLGTLYLADTYKPDKQIAGLRAPARIILSNLFVAIVSAALIYISGAWRNNTLLWRSVLLPSLSIFTVFAVISRTWTAQLIRQYAQQSRWLILGASKNTIQFAQNFQVHNSLGRLVILAEDSKQSNFSQDSSLLEQEYIVGTIADLPGLSLQRWTGVLLGNQIKLSDSLVQQLMTIRLQGIPVYRLPDIYENLWYKLPSSLLQDTWFTFSTGFNLMSGNINTRVKRVMDMMASALLLLLLSPVMLLVALAIKLDSPGPVFYSQERTGLNGKTFKVHKFRSMYQDAEKRGAQWAQKRDPRITRVGYWLRLMRIDELPQVWNVLKGEMSLIGPRPERPQFDAQLKEAIPYYDIRYLVKPGITGWAQVLYPYGASIEDAYEKLSYDLYYIKNYSIWLDIAIFFKTIRVVLLGKGR